jgi:hypothetical protein
MKNKYIMSSDTTSLDQLPVSSQTPPTNNPIQQTALGNSENVKIENYGQQLDVERKTDNSIPQIDYTAQLTSSLKDASAAGATVLPSRDIPQNTLSAQQDQETKPNFIPADASEDYIGDILQHERIIQETQRKQNQSDNMDYIYQQLQIPILVGIIYFVFQLPILRKNLFTFLPALFNKDGNPNLSGYVFNSIAFAALYSLLIKGIGYISN